MGKRSRVIEKIASATKKAKKDNEEQQHESSSSEDEATLPPGTRLSDAAPKKKGKWINKTRVLIFAARGIGHRDRHLMQNLRDMMPHSKPEVKIEARDFAREIDEVCLIKNSSKCIFFENKKRKDLYCWMSNVGRGPSVKFLLENIHTMEELKMTGNCLKASRPLLSFDPRFEQTTHHSLLKEMLLQIFSTPNHHPKSQPFFDHVITFTLLDHRIWFRNYQIVDEDGALAEVGPRFVLNPIKIFDGSFSGSILWTNEHYVSPNDRRRQLKDQAKNKYRERVLQKYAKEGREPKGAAYSDIDPNVEVFDTIAPEEASSVLKNVFRRKK